MIIAFSNPSEAHDFLIDRTMSEKGQQFTSAALGLYEVNELKRLIGALTLVANGPMEIDPDFMNQVDDLAESISSRLMIGFGSAERAEMEALAATLENPVIQGYP